MSHRWYGSTLLFLPNYNESKTHLETAITVYNDIEIPRFTEEYGHDPKALGLIFLAWAETLRGFPDKGLALSQKAVVHAETLDFPYGLAHVHFHAGNLFKDLNNPNKAKEHAEILNTIASDQSFSLFTSNAMILLGWSNHSQENSISNKQIEEGLQQLKNTGSVFFQHMLVNAHINVLLKTHQYNAAQSTIREAIGVGEKVGYSWIIPELQRLDATCIQFKEKSSKKECESRFQESLQLARQHEAKLWELRTAVSLATLWGENNERQKAYDLLYPVYSWFTEGFETEDLKQAKTLQDQLR